MRSLSTFVSSLFSLLVLSAFIVAATGAPPPPDTITVQGTFIDTKCYGMNHDNTGNEHVVPMEDGKMGKMPNCATACANMGIPVGLLEGGKKDANVYIIVTPASQLADHMAKEARVSGTLAYEGGLLPDKVEVKENGEWKEVNIATMM